MYKLKLYLDILSVCFIAGHIYLLILGIFIGAERAMIIQQSMFLAFILVINLRYNFVLQGLIKKWFKK